VSAMVVAVWCVRGGAGDWVEFIASLDGEESYRRAPPALASPTPPNAWFRERLPVCWLCTDLLIVFWTVLMRKFPLKRGPSPVGI
jgi:hypothetical protein